MALPTDILAPKDYTDRAVRPFMENIDPDGLGETQNRYLKLVDDRFAELVEENEVDEADVASPINKKILRYLKYYSMCEVATDNKTSTPAPGYGNQTQPTDKWASKETSFCKKADVLLDAITPEMIKGIGQGATGSSVIIPVFRG
jgi:hypothetical protein